MRKEFLLYTIMAVIIVGLTASQAWATPPRRQASKIETRIVCLTNTNTKSTETAACKYAVKYRFYLKELGRTHRGIKQEDNSWAKTKIKIGETKCVQPHYNVDKSVEMIVSWGICNKPIINHHPNVGKFYGGCRGPDQGAIVKRFDLGVLTSYQTNKSFYNDCSY